MADYTWKQWGQTQDNDNVINQANCERWRAGIELAGGSWSGSFEDGKDSITIDEFNALESQIQSKVSSYTPKGYDPDSSVQIVPGPDGWNKVEDGILKAVCTPDGVNRNVLLNTHDLTFEAGKILQVTVSSGSWVTTVDEDGFGVMTFDMASSGGYGAFTILSRMSVNENPWLGKRISLSVDIKQETLLEQNFSNINIYPCIYGTNDGATWTRKVYVSVQDGQLNASSFWDNTNTDELVSGEWCRLKRKATITGDPFADWVNSTETEYSTYVYGVIFRVQSIFDFQWRKPKLEVADGCTEWSPAMEDYGYSDGTITLSASASPQSVEDGDEIPAVEAGEIE